MTWTQVSRKPIALPETKPQEKWESVIKFLQEYRPYAFDQIANEDFWPV